MSKALPEPLHQRSISGVLSQPRMDWQGSRTEGLYFLENRLADRSPGGVPVLLLPGGFDPLRGTYGEELIRSLLDIPGVASVVEAHFQRECRAGYIDIEAAATDLQHVFGRSELAPIVVGMSAGTFIATVGLYRAAMHESQRTLRALMMIGPYLAGYGTWLTRAMGPFYRRQSMREKVARFCGHPHFYDNADRMGAWWAARPPLREILEQGRLREMRDRIDVPVELLYFRFDTLNRRGRRLLLDALGATVIEPPIPGHHRALHSLTDANERVAAFVRQHLPAVAAGASSAAA